MLPEVARNNRLTAATEPRGRGLFFDQRVARAGLPPTVCPARAKTGCR